MDFNIKKPTHLLALLGLIIVFAITIILPILSFFGFFPSTAEGVGTLSPSVQIIFEIILILFQLALVAGLFIGEPTLWYALVNRLSLRNMFAQLQIKKQGFSSAILWGIITMIIGFIAVVAVDLILLGAGFDLSQQSNIEDLGKLLSPPGMFIILTIQPVAEEIFFRGFLLQKIQSWKGPTIAIIATSILFGCAHLSYGKIYPMIMTALVGGVLAYMVIKTKNLMTGIVAHILFNIASFSLYYLAQNLIP
jgi:membrane protease YdiL (CAAX protease family)